MGGEAASLAAANIRQLLSEKEEVNILRGILARIDQLLARR